MTTIGNGSFGAVIDKRGRIVWCCLNGFDEDPIFNSLLNNDSDEVGFFDIAIQDLAKSDQKYIPNTAVLVTTLVSERGDVVQIKDFAPRSAEQRPCELVRVVTRIRGDPIVTIRARPSFHYNTVEPVIVRTPHWVGYSDSTSATPAIYLSTSMSTQAVVEESSFVVHDPVVFRITSSLPHTSPQALHASIKLAEEETIQWWKTFASSFALPVDYQEILVRSAISLQCMQSEDSGGILTSLTLGIPLGPDLPPSTDGRTVGLAETCLALPLLRDMGMFETVKRFLVFLKNIVTTQSSVQQQYSSSGKLVLAPALSRSPLVGLSGYLGAESPIGATSGEERGNPATGFGEVDPGAYGLVVVALTSAFCDVRLKDIASPKLFDRLEQLGDVIVRAFSELSQPAMLVSTSTSSSDVWGDQPSISPPLRGGVHTFTSVLCWAAVDRLARTAEHCRKIEKGRKWTAHAQSMRNEILQNAIDHRRGVFTTVWGGSSVGPSLLRLAEIGFIHSKDPLFVSTVEAFESDALNACITGSRIVSPELVPSTPFSTCTLLWYTEALRAVGRDEEARSLFHAICANSNECGLVSESVDLKDGRNWGNIATSPVAIGLLRAGSRLSRTWQSV